MSDTDITPAPPTAIPWYQSNIYRGLMVTLLSQGLSAFKVTGSLAPQAAQIVDALFEIMSVSGVAWAAYSRAKHPIPTVTTTQAKATAINVTAASIAVSTAPESPK